MVRTYPGMTIDYVLYEMSWANIQLYNRVIPSLDDKEDKFDESKDANNPDNFKDEPDEVEVR